MSVYDEIREERAAQDAKWGGPEHDDRHTIWGWAHFLRRHVVRATDAVDLRGSAKRIVFRRQMIRAAALAVAAVEALDRTTPKEPAP